MSQHPGQGSLVSFWSMDEKSGTRYDKSPQGNDLTEYNSVGMSATGKRFRAANFVAANLEYLKVPHNSYVDFSGNTPFTIGFWVKPHDINSDSRIIAKWTDGPASGKEYIVSLFGAQFHLNVSDGTNTYVVSSFTSLSNYTWYFVCVYYDATTDAQELGIGVNDSWVTESAAPVFINWDDTNDFYVACNKGNQNFFDGLLDEMFMYKNRLLTPAERTFFYNSGYGRIYEDVVNRQPPVVSIDTSFPAGNLPIHVFDNALKRIDIIEDYYSLSWAERYNEVGDFELDVPMSWEASPSVAFGNFLQIKSSDKLMIIEDKKVSTDESKRSIVITGRSAESLLNRRVLEDPINVEDLSEMIMHEFIFDNITFPLNSKRQFTLFDPGMLTMLLPAEHKDVFEVQTVYEAIVTIAKAAVLGFKVVCGDLDAASPKLTFYVYEGADRSYAQSANPWIVFSEKFNNILTSSFYSSEKNLVSVTRVFTDDVPPLYEFWGWLVNPEPEDMDRIETLLEINLSRDSTDPPMGVSEFINLVDTRQMKYIKDSGPIGLLEGDFDIQLNNIYGEDFYMGDIVQCNIHGIEVGARVIELVRSYSAEGEKTYLGLDFIMV